MKGSLFQKHVQAMNDSDFSHKSMSVDALNKYLWNYC